MNVKRLKLMQTMLAEVIAGTWKPKPVVLELYDNSNSDNLMMDLNTKTSKVNFDLSEWVSTKHTEKPYVCGFTACAVGHAVLDKRFNKLGLTCTQDGVPSFDGASNWFAVSEFFEIGDQAKQSLFSSTAYGENIKGNNLVTQVIRRIDKLLIDGEEKFNDNEKISEYYSLDKNLHFRKLSSVW